MKSAAKARRPIAAMAWAPRSGSRQRCTRGARRRSIIPCAHDRTGGGLSDDGSRWCDAGRAFSRREGALTPVPGRSVRNARRGARRGPITLLRPHCPPLADRKTFKRSLAPLRRAEWIVYVKDPFGAAICRARHRVVISNRRLVSVDDGGIAFRWKHETTTSRALEDDDAHAAPVHTAAFSSTCCELPPHPLTYGSSPTPIAPRASLGLASCSALLRASSSPRRRRPPRQRSRCVALPALRPHDRHRGVRTRV